VEVVELVVRLISMGRGSKSIRRWRKERKRKRRSAKNESLPPPIKDLAAADRGADNPVRLLPLFLAAQQSRLLPRLAEERQDALRDAHLGSWLKTRAGRPCGGRQV
jgi:hypothetical protein